MQFENQDLKLLIERYNKNFAEAYDKALNDNALFDQASTENTESELRYAVCEAIKNWYTQPIDENNSGMTGADVLDSVNSLDDALELARYTAGFCDDEFPDIIKSKLSSFGQPMIDGLTEAVLATDFRSRSSALSEADLPLAISAEYLKLLGDWKFADSAAAMLDKFTNAEEPDEMIADAVRYYLVQNGPAVLPLIMDALNRVLSACSELNASGEYLLITMTDIGRAYPSDEIFKCLRDVFRKSNSKAIAAACIGDYGDGRGVSVLRGWLERNPEFADRQIIAEILSAIHRLGGETADLRHLLRL